MGKVFLLCKNKWIPCEEGLRSLFSDIWLLDLVIKDLWIDYRWDINLIKRTFNDVRVVKDIMKTHIPYSQPPDRKVWIFFQEQRIIH